MCLYPKLINNPKYRKTIKNGGIIPECRDERVKLIPVVATIKQNFKIALSQELLNKANIRLKDAEIQEITNNITVANKQVQINREKMENDLNIGIKANNNGIISKDVKGIANTLIEAFSGQEDYFK